MGEMETHVSFPPNAPSRKTFIIKKFKIRYGSLDYTSPKNGLTPNAARRLPRTFGALPPPRGQNAVRSTGLRPAKSWSCPSNLQKSSFISADRITSRPKLVLSKLERSETSFPQKNKTVERAARTSTVHGNRTNYSQDPFIFISLVVLPLSFSSSFMVIYLIVSSN